MACFHDIVPLPPGADALRILEAIEAGDVSELDGDPWDSFHDALEAHDGAVTVYWGLVVSHAMVPLLSIDARDLLWTAGARSFDCTGGMTEYLGPAAVVSLAARLAAVPLDEIEKAIKQESVRPPPVPDLADEADVLLGVIRNAATDGRGLLIQFVC